MKSQVVLDANLNCSELAHVVAFEIEAKPCLSCALFINQTCTRYRCELLKPEIKVRCVFHEDIERVNYGLALFEGLS